MYEIDKGGNIQLVRSKAREFNVENTNKTSQLDKAIKNVELARSRLCFELGISSRDIGESIAVNGGYISISKYMIFLSSPERRLAE